MIVSVALAAYCLLDLAISAFVAILWRTRAIAPADLPPAVRARRLMLLRLVPGISATLITIAVVTPAFAIFEPHHDNEAAGPALMLLAIAGLAQLIAALTRSIRSVMLTAAVERLWLRSSSALDVGRSMPAFAIDSPSPIVALVGVFTPKLIAARSVIDACTPEEVACIVGHERGHLQSRDNMKRWVMASLPDVLSWTPIHREMIDAWHHAAEDAADDAATGGEEIARAELAALLLKVVRLAPQPQWHSAIVSPFVEDRGLERRVRRLLKPELEPPAPLAIVPMVAVTSIVIALLAALASPDALEAIFEAFESLVAFGR
jgi:beta-lactamase regulating signal transducer with metallopeptidase domain